MGWHGKLDIHYRRERNTTVAHDRHHGPLRVLQRLYPEGPGICHHTLVHPPGGIVGGDVLDIELKLGAGTHAVITTPGATRFYRSAGELAGQRATVHLEAGARLEWLPLEGIAYSGCIAENRFEFELDDGAEMIGWDLLALGMPASGEAFERGRFTQHVAWPGVWLERGAIDALDTTLLDSPLGLAGRRVLATLWLACGGSGFSDAARELLLDAARAQAVASQRTQVVAGSTATDRRVIVLRALGDRVEPVFDLLKRVRASWRQLRWGLGANPPRIWQT